MKKWISFLTVMVLTLVMFSSIGYSLEKVTHEAINQKIAQRTISGFSLNDYLMNNLGFKAGFKEPMYGYSGKKKQNVTQRVYEWLGEGGWMEDVPPDDEKSWEGLKILLANKARANNHFHNPLKTNWDEAGLNDELPVLGQFTGQSQVLWAQNTNQHVGGRWSWKDAREYFYIALTGKDFTGNNVTPLPGETEKEKRERYYTNTFRGVGQLMHLVEDASVPQHVRNDIHVVPAYEAAVENMRTDKTKYPYQWDDWMNNPKSFDKSILDIPSDTPVPISRIIDTNKYTGSNPNITTGLDIGLSEYTNANFLSEDTMFTDGFDPNHRHYFPYPSRTAAILWKDDFNNYPYFKKESEGETVYHLATIGFLGMQRWRYFPQYNMSFPVDLDDRCYEEYATKLIPRTVGYAAGLLDYFFRGNIEITPPDQVAYAVTDGSQTPYVDDYGNYHQQFRSIKAKVRNTTSDEDMQNGIIQAVAKYKIIPNYMYDLSNYPPVGNVMKKVEYTYSVSTPIEITSLSSTEPTEFSFNFSDNPIPAGITDLYLFIVFKGTLGNETNIAIAVGMKDLMEPTHQVFWNLTDMFSLYIQEAYHLYLSDYNPAYPEIPCIRYDLSLMCDQSLLELVDFNDNGVPNEEDEPYIDPFSMTFGIGYLSGPPQQGGIFYYSAITTVQPGRHIRLIALMDKPQDNYLALVVSNDMFGTAYYYITSPGVVNQEEDGIYQTPTPITTFRYGLDGDTQIPIKQHFYMGIINCYPIGGIDPYGNPTCAYPEEESIPAELSPFSIETVYFYQAVFFNKLTTYGVSVEDAVGQPGVVIK